MFPVEWSSSDCLGVGPITEDCCFQREDLISDQWQGTVKEKQEREKRESFRTDCIHLSCFRNV